MDKVLKIVIGNGGKCSVETLEGFTGTGCAKTVEQILVSVGGEVTSAKHKSEYYDDAGDSPVSVFQK